ncbi:MAG: histidine kinase [Bacteroidota bacterium]
MRQRLILLAFIYLFPLLPDAQFVFNNLQAKDGLIGKEVICVYKDTEGFMWFGTTMGLCRYDGSNFKVYNRINKKFPGLSNEFITGIAGNGPDKIWIASRGGLFSYHKVSGVFEPITILNEKNVAVPNPNIEKLWKDNQGRLWIATQVGLFVYKDDKIVPVSAIYPKASLLNSQFIIGASSVVDTFRHGMWVGAAKGQYFIDFINGELYSPAYNPMHWSLVDSVLCAAMAIDHAGNLWFTKLGHYLARLNFKTNSIDEDYSYINTPDRKLTAHSYRLSVDSKNRLWSSNWSGKIFVREPGGKFIILPDESPTTYKLPIGMFHEAYEDSEHNIWIAGANGVSKLSPEHFLKTIVELPENMATPGGAATQINNFTQAGHNTWWACKDDGLYLWNEQTGDIKRYATPGVEAKQTRFFDIQYINGKWWCSTGDGIQIFDSATARFSTFKYYPKGHEIKNRSVMWIRKDRKNMIWFAAWGDAVYRFDPVTNKCIRFDESTISDSSFGPTNSLFMLEAADGKIWLSYGYQGVRIFDQTTGRFSKPGTNTFTRETLGNQVLLKVIEDKQHNKWVATKIQGLLKLNSEGNIIDSITTDNGLTVPYVSDVLMDEAGMLWATTSDGLHYIDPKTKAVSKLNLDLGLPSHDPSGAMITAGGKLYGSMVHRIAVIDLSAVGKFSSPSAPIISGISVFEKEVPIAPVDPSLKLNYDQNFFTIEFSSPNHRDIISMQYAYRLKGFDKDWVYCGRRQTAAYTNVPNGNYTFSVKCTDANGQWIEKETVVHITIDPPFWKTWWFIGILALLAAFAVWRFYILSLKRKQKGYIDKTIDYFANSVYGQNSVNEICWDIARNCISQLHFEDCVVYLLDEERKVMVQKAAFGPKNPKGHEIDNPLEIPLGKGLVGTVAATGKPLLIADTTKDERYIVDDERRMSEIAVPILHDGQVIGVIDSEHRQKNFFNADHLKALSTIASISSNKIAEAKAEALARENEIKLLEINKLLAESQLMALRAQMNPHFVFNCLNSIQECIVTQKYGEASNYLNKFSKLFRMVLNNSGQDLVTIDSEKETLELYLALEAMRFEKSFSYTFEVDEELETDEILIPSMLLQPYVENALWHGLMHKDGERTLAVSFTRMSEDVFECVIDDNGIGRKKALEIKEQQSKTKRHESKGMRISKDRLDLLELQGNHAQINIVDKYNEEGIAIGTKVIIELSTFLKTH